MNASLKHVTTVLCAWCVSYQLVHVGRVHIMGSRMFCCDGLVKICTISKRIILLNLNGTHASEYLTGSPNQRIHRL